MNSLKTITSLFISLALVFVLGLIGFAQAGGTQTKCTFDPKNGATKTTITLSADNSFQSVIPTAPIEPSRKLFIGWASQSAKHNFPSIIFERAEAGLGTFSFSDGVTRSYVANYATIQTAKIYPDKNFGYLSEHTNGYAQTVEQGQVESLCANDYYWVNLTKGTTYYFGLNMPGRNPNFYLYNADFSMIKSSYISVDNEDLFAHFGDKIIELTPTASGIYYVGVCASQYDEMGLYQMVFSTEKVIFPKYHIQWISSGKTAWTSELDPGENISAPPIARWGHTLAGWYHDTSFTKAFKVDEEIMPVANISFFAKWTSNESEIKSLYKSSGRLTQKWTGVNYINRLKISSRTSNITIKPVQRNSKATVFMKYENGTYKSMNSKWISLKRGQTKTVYIKCVSQTGTKYTSTYKLFVTRNR